MGGTCSFLHCHVYGCLVCLRCHRQTVDLAGCTATTCECCKSRDFLSCKAMLGLAAVQCMQPMQWQFVIVSGCCIAGWGFLHIHPSVCAGRNDNLPVCRRRCLRNQGVHTHTANWSAVNLGSIVNDCATAFGLLLFVWFLEHGQHQVSMRVLAQMFTSVASTSGTC